MKLSIYPFRYPIISRWIYFLNINNLLMEIHFILWNVTYIFWVKSWNLHTTEKGSIISLLHLLSVTKWGVIWGYLLNALCKEKCLFSSRRKVIFILQYVYMLCFKLVGTAEHNVCCDMVSVKFTILSFN